MNNNPYRNNDPAAQEELKKRKRQTELAMLGVRKGPDGEWRPLLEREHINACRECNGFGTYGNPFAGAIYNCDRCNGTGTDPDILPKPKIKWYRKIMEWFRAK